MKRPTAFAAGPLLAHAGANLFNDFHDRDADADIAQRGSWSAAPLAAGVPVALLITAILHVNGFADRAAYAAAGKNTIVVKLGPSGAARVYLALVSAAYLWLGAAVLAGALPIPALAGLLAAPLSAA